MIETRRVEPPPAKRAYRVRLTSEQYERLERAWEAIKERWASRGEPGCPWPELLVTLTEAHLVALEAPTPGGRGRRRRRK